MRLSRASACAAIVLSVVGVSRVAYADDEAPAKDPADTELPRPPLPPGPPRKTLPWQEHLEVGGGALFAVPLTSKDGDDKPTDVRLKPYAGFHLRLSWEVLRYLWFTGYLNESRHRVVAPAGSLGLPTSLTGDRAWKYTFGARISPTLPIGTRVRLWLTAGAGWGQIRYQRLCPKTPCGSTFVVRERAAAIVEVPMGFGASFEVIPRWLRVHMELTGALAPSQTGPAYDHTQAIDANGKIRDVGPMPRIDATIVQTIGLSLVL
jgi:hypothetical protein